MPEVIGHQIWTVGEGNCVIWCFTKKHCARHNAWSSTLSLWSCQSPVVHSYSLLNLLNSSHRGMFKLNAKLDGICCCTCSVILNVMATQYTCSLNGVYCPQWLLQWSHHCSCMHIPVHSLWLPGYINVMQTILVILTMLDFFWTDLVYYITNMSVFWTLHRLCIFPITKLIWGLKIYFPFTFSVLNGQIITLTETGYQAKIKVLMNVNEEFT